MTTLIETRGAEPAEAVLTRLYSRISIASTVPDGEVRLRIDRISAGAIQVDRVQTHLHARFTAAPLGAVPLARVNAGQLRRRVGATEQVFGPGDLLLLAAPDESYEGTIDDVDLSYIGIDAATLARVAGEGTDPVRFTGLLPVSADAAASLTATYRFIESMRGANAPLVVAALDRLLAATVLSTFPNSVVARRDREGDRDSSPGTLRRAIAFIDANADADIALADIARAARVTPRAVQLAFRRDRDTTPLAYLRRVRLESARGELRSATSGDGRTVTSIASRWGFDSSSRFSRLYRETFGELPSTTLRR